MWFAAFGLKFSSLVDGYKFLIEAQALDPEARIGAEKRGIDRLDGNREKNWVVAELGERHLVLAARNEDCFRQPGQLFGVPGLDSLAWEIDTGLVRFGNDAPVKKTAHIVARDTTDEITVAVLLP